MKIKDCAVILVRKSAKTGVAKYTKDVYKDNIILADLNKNLKRSKKK